CNLTSVDEYLFQLPANQVYAVDEHAKPTTLHRVDELDLNCTQAKKIAATKIDHTVKAANDLWEMTIAHPQQALAVSLSSGQPWV
ncbi:aldose epimerase, partial [Escherichia coli]|nr:aldose epimerase [Escherichia coli]